MLSSDGSQLVMLRKLRNEPNLQKIHFPEGCLCALVLRVSDLGEVPGTFCLVQLISHTTSSCRASHRRWRWDWSTLRSPASEGWRVQMAVLFHQGSLVAGSWSPWCSDKPNPAYWSLWEEQGGQSAAPPAFPFWGFPCWSGCGESWLPVVYNLPCNSIMMGLTKHWTRASLVAWTEG